MKHRIRTKTQQLKMFDYVGATLFVAGLILFEIGFLWGGGVSDKTNRHHLFAIS